MLTSLHLEVATGSNMFKNYEELEQLCIDVLQQCRQDVQLLNLAYTIELDKIPFKRRKQVPLIEQKIL